MPGRIVYLSDVPTNGSVRLFDGEPDMMSVPKVAELLGVNARTVRREISRGAIRCTHVGARVLITKTALLEYVEQATV